MISIPPFSFFLILILGGFLLSLIPNPSNSFSIIILCIAGLVESNTIMIRLQVLATAIIYFPFPLLSLAPSTIPGKSNNYNLQPLSLRTPGMHVNVVNSHSAISDFVPVNLVKSVDFPTDGNPINPILASPFFATSKPSPPLPLALIILSNCSLLSLAILALRRPRWPSVFLFF